MEGASTETSSMDYQLQGTDMEPKANRFQNPTPLNMETRVLRDVVEGGVSLREFNEAFQRWWTKNVCQRDEKKDV